MRVYHGEPAVPVGVDPAARPGLTAKFESITRQSAFEIADRNVAQEVDKIRFACQKKNPFAMRFGAACARGRN